MLKIEIDKALLSDDVLKNVIKNIKYNELIEKYYLRFAHESACVAFDSDLLIRKKEHMQFCNMLWRFDTYQVQKVKDFKSTNLCHDKFCANCKKVRQSSRMAKYIPDLEQYKDNFYHVTLTVPNVSGIELRDTIKKMSKCFRKLIRYVNCHEECFFDFSAWNYEGALRSLEVTFRDDSYHPHFHVGLVADFKLSEKIYKNQFSFNNSFGLLELKRLFSLEEVTIQKLWYMIFNDIKITYDNFSKIDVGYSCTIDKFDSSDYAELFKYMTKEKAEDGKVLSYDNFVSLYYGTYRMKQLQGYGCLYNITDDGDEETFDKMYDDYISNLRQKEMPVDTLDRPQDILKNKDFTYISRKSYFKYLRQL